MTKAEEKIQELKKHIKNLEDTINALNEFINYLRK